MDRAARGHIDMQGGEQLVREGEGVGRGQGWEGEGAMVSMAPTVVWARRDRVVTFSLGFGPFPFCMLVVFLFVRRSDDILLSESVGANC